MAANKHGRKKHVPQRSCVVCRTTQDKRELTRLVRTPDDGVWVDPTGKRAGRGAYLCHNPACWQKAMHTDIVGKTLRTQLTNADRQRLAEAIPTQLLTD